MVVLSFRDWIPCVPRLFMFITSDFIWRSLLHGILVYILFSLQTESFPTCFVQPSTRAPTLRLQIWADGMTNPNWNPASMIRHVTLPSLPWRRIICHRVVCWFGFFLLLLIFVWDELFFKMDKMFLGKIIHLSSSKSCTLKPLFYRYPPPTLKGITVLEYTHKWLDRKSVV